MISIEKAKKQGKVVIYRNNFLSSKHDPIFEGARLFKTLPTHAKAVICLGIGPLYHLCELIKVSKKVILIEPRLNLKEKWRIFLHHFPFLESASHDNFSGPFVVLDKSNISLLDEAIFQIPDSIKINDIYVYDQLKKMDVFLNPQKIKQQVITSLDNREKYLNTENYFSKIWLKNAIFNLEHNSINPVSSLNVSSTQGVLIGSGPNLEHQIEEIRGKKIFKCAVSGVINYLLDKKIVPDCILSSDASFYNSYHFEALQANKLTIPVIVPLSIAHQCIKHYLGKVYIFFDDPVIIEEMEKHGLDEKILKELKDNFVNMQASVIISGLFIFVLLGIKEISVLGANFSSTPFKSHALSNTTEEIMFSQGKKLKPFENRYHYLYSHHLKKMGKNNWSDKKLILYKDLFQKACDSLKVKIIKPAHLTSCRRGANLDKKNHYQNPGFTELMGEEKMSFNIPKLLKNNWLPYKASILKR